MTTNKQMVPELRFKGFTDPWEQRKLGELGSTFTGLTGKTKEDFGHGDAKFVTYMNVFQNAVASLEQLDSVEIDPKQNEVKKGDVFFTTSSETPEEVGMSSVWKYNYDNVYLNSFTFGYRPNIEFDLDYLAAMLRSTTVRKKITFLAQGISRYNISKTKMMDIEVPVPSLEEQAKIGAFLSNVEQTITLHQRKLEKLQELKKGYLQKLFPKNGSKFPQLRFAGFTDAWEKRPIKKIATVNGGKDYKHLNKGDIPVYGTGGYMLSVDQALSEENGIGIGRKGTINSPYILRAPYWTVDTLFYVIPKGTQDLNFLYAIFQRVNWKKYDESTGVPSLSKQTINAVEVTTPTQAEQELIGTMFKQLDNLIAVNQRKVELLKKLKQAYLQKMFV